MFWRLQWPCLCGDLSCIMLWGARALNSLRGTLAWLRTLLLLLCTDSRAGHIHAAAPAITKAAQRSSRALLVLSCCAR